jgi:NADPH-dependent curcumin reductase CurA
MSSANRQWRVARYPQIDEPISTALFDWVETGIPTPGDGEFVVRSICLGTGPAQRGYLSPGRGEFLSLVPLGQVMRGRGVGQIVSSRHPDYPAGRIFVGSLGWQDYSVQQPRGKQFVFSTKLVAEPIRPLSLELGILGQAGVTAYFGLIEVGRMKPGDRVLVSAAAGGVGSVVGQIARIQGAETVVGVAGTDEKCRWLTRTLGLSAAVNYRRDDLDARLAELFPNGIDLFFDNVGGATLDTALLHLAERARVVICGFISSDYRRDPGPGPINYRKLVSRRARMEGFVVFDYWERFAEAEAALRDWYAQGLLHSCEDIDEGLENMPASLASLFSGTNRGVKLCRVAPDPAPGPG